MLILNPSQNRLSVGNQMAKVHTQLICCGYGYKVVCCYDDKYSKPVQIFRRGKIKKNIEKTKEDERDFKKSDECHICDKKYTEKETIVISPENTEDRVTKTVMSISD